MEVSQIAVLTGISRNTINRMLRDIRQMIFELWELESPFGQGEIEIDESYFGAGRKRRVRERGTGGKTVAQVDNNCSVKELVPIILKRVGFVSVI